MSRKYELWFANNEINQDVEVKIMTFIIDDERFTNYILETIMSNLKASKGFVITTPDSGGKLVKEWESFNA